MLKTKQKKPGHIIFGRDKKKNFRQDLSLYTVALNPRFSKLF